MVAPGCISEEGARRCTVCTERGSAAGPAAPPATPASKTRSRHLIRSCESVTRASTSSSRTRACSRLTADISRPCWRARRRRRRRRVRPLIPPARLSLSRRPTDSRSDRSPPYRSRPLVNMDRSMNKKIPRLILIKLFQVFFELEDLMLREITLYLSSYSRICGKQEYLFLFLESNGLDKNA